MKNTCFLILTFFCCSSGNCSEENMGLTGFLSLCKIDTVKKMKETESMNDFYFYLGKYQAYGEVSLYIDHYYFEIP